MNQKLSLFASLLVTSLAFTACSSGGGGGSSSSSSGQASGPLSVPSATCNGSACMSGSSLAFTATSASVLNVATEVYTYFNGTIIPNLNSTLYRMEQAAADNGMTTCSDIVGAQDSLSEYLGDGFYVAISSTGLKTAPSEMGSVAMTKGFVFAKGVSASDRFAEAQIACNGTERTFYVRVVASSTLAYEFWAQEDGAKRIIFGAVDDSSNASHNSKITFYFNTADGDKFQLHGIANDVQFGGLWVNLAVAGGAQLSTGIADIENLAGTAATGTASYGENGADSRYCYSDVEAGTTDTSTPSSTCSGLLSAVTTTDAVRSSGAWKYGDMNTAISTSF
jgi:hypothetical protein